MKRLIILSSLFVFIFSLPVCAQEEGNDDDEIQTIFSDGIERISGFGGPIMSFTSFDNDFAFEMGGGGAVLINRSLFLGGYGMGITNDIEPSSANYSSDYIFDFGHGGFWVGYIFQPTHPLHLNFSTQIGWGGINLQQQDNYNDNTLEADQVFVLTPALQIEMNVTQFFRIAAGANYRFVTGVEMEDYNSTDFSSPGAFLSFTFGGF